jgi:hypothetical protein
MRNLLSRGRPLAGGLLAAGLTLGGAITAIPAQAASTPAGSVSSSIAAAHTLRGGTPSRAQLIRAAAAAGRISQAAAAATPNVSIEEWQVGPFGTGVGGYAGCILDGTLDFNLPDVLYWYCSPDSSGQWYLYVWLINLFGGANQQPATTRELSRVNAHQVS